MQRNTRMLCAVFSFQNYQRQGRKAVCGISHEDSESNRYNADRLFGSRAWSSIVPSKRKAVEQGAEIRYRRRRVIYQEF